MTAWCESVFGVAPLDPWALAILLAVPAVMLLVIRPLAGWISLLGVKRPKLERAIIAFFGIRGLGSVYYLSYGFNHATFDYEYNLWGTLGLIIAASILMHGVLVTPALDRLTRHYRQLGIVKSNTPV